jgi:hypothetical protein
MSISPLQQVAIWASVVVAVAAVVSLAVGIWDYNRNAQAQVQLTALSVLQNYLNLAVQNPELASHDPNDPVDARYAWFAAHALNTAQTLQVLVGHHEDWQRAIDAIIRRQQPYLRSGLFECRDFSPAFVTYLRAQVAALGCAQPPQVK